MNSSKKAVLDLLWNEPYKIGHWVGFKDLTTLHNEWLRSFLYAEIDQTLLAHRGSYKTTDLSLFLAIHTVIDPNENVMFFRKTDCPDPIWHRPAIPEREQFGDTYKSLYFHKGCVPGGGTWYWNQHYW